jgi:hypothetical protein
MSGLIFSIIESPSHPVLTPVYRKKDFEEQRFNTMRKAIGALKKQQPDFVVAEFFYGYGNNYAGANISNLDVFLRSLQKYSPESKVIVLASPAEMTFVDKLTELFPVHAILPQPVDLNALETALET